MAKSKTRAVDRRGFLKGAAAAAALAVKPPIVGVDAQTAEPRRTVPPPSPGQVASETSPPPPRVGVYTVDRPGSDFMIDVIKSLGFEYVAANPGSSFRGLHESIINYGGNKSPELLTCCHEESSVAMAHGYAKIEGKPMMVMAHGTVGLQHASMAIYNAFADRVPVYIVLGNILDIAYRRSVVEWSHSVQDAVAMVRDYTKWDDMPASLSHFGESAVRAYKLAMTPAMGPVVIVADAVMQEEPIPQADRHTLRVPKLTLAAPPAGDAGAIADAARMLVAAENPVIVAGRCARTPNGLKLLVELAETLQAPVQDRPFRFRMNFPTRHPLYGGGSVADADVILGLEVPDFWNATHAQTPVNRVGMEVRPTTKAGAKQITISSTDLLSKSNYQDFGPYAEVDLSIAADAEASLPSLIEACKRLIGSDRRTAFAARGAKFAEAAKRTRQQALEQAAWGWDAQPDHDGPAVGRTVEPDQERRLVARVRRRVHELLADAAVGFRQALSVHRRAGRVRNRLRRAGGGRRRAGEQETRSADRQHSMRRRSELRARRVVDGRAPPHPAPDDHAQQPCVSSGAHVRAGHGRARGARNRSGQHRHRHHRSEHRLRHHGEGVRHVQRWTDRESKRPGAGDSEGY